MKVFFDTNVLISAFAARGLCADLMRVVLAGHELQTGEVNLTELRRVLRDRFKAPAAQVDFVVALLSDQTIVAKPDALTNIKVRDADDAWVLASAIAGGAELLVTGDKDLLVIAAVAPVPIVTPREAWERLRQGAA
ncbi:MAG TPA: putative toxin-antitoxin system toxin component, PIN family [Gemmatimonadaceae bacterium]|nr:putative toxin-antitoxin system toxin component, PIN family [Gemmatimonadaceae bacterium]